MTLQLSERVISGEIIEIGREATVLGPGLLLSGCHLRLATSARALTIAPIRVERCTIEAIRPLTNARWGNAWIEASRFRGTFTGCDFGTWPEHYDPGGGIKDCDLGGATLDGCRFFGDDVASLQLPAWPCFVIEAPKATSARLAGLSWPAKLRHWVAGLEWAPDEARALVEYAPRILERFGGTETELREALIAAEIAV